MDTAANHDSGAEKRVHQDGALLGYLDYWLRFFQGPRQTLRRYGPRSDERVSRHLVAFLVFSLVLAAGLYEVRLRLGWPRDEGVLADALRALGSEFLPIVALLGLIGVAVVIEVVRLSVAYAPLVVGREPILREWSGMFATLNGLVGFAAIFIPTGMLIVMAIEATFRHVPTPWAIAVAFVLAVCVMVLLFGYFPVTMTAMHPHVHGWRLGLASAVAMLMVVYATTGEWRDFPKLLLIVGLVAVTGELVLRQRRVTDSEPRSADSEQDLEAATP